MRPKSSDNDKLGNGIRIRLTESEKKLQQAGISLWLAGLNPEPLQLIQKSALGKALGRSRMCFNLEQAVTSYLKQLADPK